MSSNPMLALGPLKQKHVPKDVAYTHWLKGAILSCHRSSSPSPFSAQQFMHLSKYATYWTKKHAACTSLQVISRHSLAKSV